MQQKPALEIAARDLYDRDYVLWVEQTLMDLQAGNFQNLDLENLIDEIEGMVRAEKNALKSNLIPNPT
ncbi:MAG: DUF29 family protein [Geitlerinemataceae cyanobacterium]